MKPNSLSEQGARAGMNEHTGRAFNRIARTGRVQFGSMLDVFCRQVLGLRLLVELTWIPTTSYTQPGPGRQPVRVSGRRVQATDFPVLHQ